MTIAFLRGRLHHWAEQEEVGTGLRGCDESPDLTWQFSVTLGFKTDSWTHCL